MTEKPITKWSKAELADAYGTLKAKAKPIDEQMEAIKEELGRRKIKIAEGLKFSLVVRVSSFMGLKIKAIREEMGEAWCKARQLKISKTYYDVTPVAKE